MFHHYIRNERTFRRQSSVLSSLLLFCSAFILSCYCLFCLSLVCLCLSLHVSSYRPPFPYCGPSIYHTFAPRKLLHFSFVPSSIRPSVRLPHRHSLSAWCKSGSRQQNSKFTFLYWIKGTETCVVEAFYLSLVLYHMDK